MVCGQCGAGLSAEMVKEGACGFCGTATEGLGTAHVEETVDNRVREAEVKIQRDLDKKIARQLKDNEPSVVVVAAAEAGRYTAAKIWGCGAGCLSTVGSVLFLLFIIGMQFAPQLIQEFRSRTGKPNVERPESRPSPHPAPKPNKKRPGKKR